MLDMFFAILVNILFSLIFPLGKIAMTFCPPFFFIGLRMLCAGLIYLLIWSGFHKEKYSISLDFFRKVVLLGIFNIFLTNAFEFWGLQFMTSAKTAFIYNLSPFFSAALGYIYFDEKMTLKKIIGLIISFFGFIPIFNAIAPAEEGLHHLFIFSTAEMSLLVAAFSSVVGWIIMQGIVRKRPEDIPIANGISMIFGSFFSFLVSFFFESPISFEHSNISSTFLPFTMLLLLISLITVTIYALYSYLLTVYTATFMTMICMTGPLFAALFDWMFFGIIVSSNFFIAMFLVFAGLYLFYQEDLRLGYTIPRPRKNKKLHESVNN